MTKTKEFTHTITLKVTLRADTQEQLDQVEYALDDTLSNLEEHIAVRTDLAFPFSLEVDTE